MGDCDFLLLARRPRVPRQNKNSAALAILHLKPTPADKHTTEIRRLTVFLLIFIYKHIFSTENFRRESRRVAAKMCLQHFLLLVLPLAAVANVSVSKVTDDGVLAPKYFNLAKGSRITATATCGEEKPEVFCKLSAGSDYMADPELDLLNYIPTGTGGQVIYCIFRLFKSKFCKILKQRRALVS